MKYGLGNGRLYIGYELIAITGEGSYLERLGTKDVFHFKDTITYFPQNKLKEERVVWRGYAENNYTILEITMHYPSNKDLMNLLLTLSEGTRFHDDLIIHCYNLDDKKGFSTEVLRW